MQPTLDGWNVRARCPNCSGAVTTFECTLDGKEFGTVIVNGSRRVNDRDFPRTIYKLLRCASCGRGALAETLCNNQGPPGLLVDFTPATIDTLPLPTGIPNGIVNEYREAERCASIKAWRAASALLRSTLEKTLKSNGIPGKDLKAKIDTAAADGVITEARKKRAHDDVRVLGNDVLHDEWRDVTAEEVEASHKYVHRILEDLYDDRPSIEAILKAKGRIS